MINTVSFIEIVLEQLIKEARDLQSKATDESTREEVGGYSFAIERILGNAAGNDLFDYLPDNLKNFDTRSLEVFPEVPK